VSMASNEFWTVIMMYVVCCMLYVIFCSLGGNGIGDEGARAIAEALKVNATITNIR
jgi:hypothetical protein